MSELKSLNDIFKTISTEKFDNADEGDSPKDKVQGNAKEIDSSALPNTKESSQHISPFAWHENMTPQFYNPHINKKKSIMSLIQSRFFDSDIKSMLFYFKRYTYLNAYLASLLFLSEHDGTDEYPRSILKKLVDSGLLIRMTLKYPDDSGKYRFTSPIYFLSERGKLFLKITNSDNYKDIPLEEIEIDILLVLRTLSFNQYYIKMHNAYGSSLLRHDYSFQTDSVSLISADSILSFCANKKTIYLHVISMRSGGCNWENQLRLVFEKYSTDEQGLYLILCESELFALRIEQAKRQMHQYNTNTLLYLCDYATMDDSMLLNHLLYINSADLKGYEICQFAVD